MKKLFQQSILNRAWTNSISNDTVKINGSENIPSSAPEGEQATLKCP